MKSSSQKLKSKQIQSQQLIHDFNKTLNKDKIARINLKNISKIMYIMGGKRIKICVFLLNRAYHCAPHYYPISNKSLLSRELHCSRRTLNLSLEKLVEVNAIIVVRGGIKLNVGGEK